MGDLLPEAIDFNFCTVSETAIREVVLENRQSVAVGFHIESVNFKFQPQKGTLPPSHSQRIQIQYTPQEAKVVVASAIFHIEGEEPKVMKLSAIGKIPYLTINRK